MPSNPWTFAAEIYLPNDVDDFDVAAKRLLGAELLAACELCDSDAAEVRRRTAEAQVQP